MKLRKIIGTILICIMLISIISMFSSTYADTNTYKLGIVRLRKTGYGYKIVPTGSTEKTVWKIVSYDNSTVNYDKAIYCIKAGQGFGSSWTSENISSTVDYKEFGDLKEDRDTIKSKFSAVSMFSNDTVYNEVLWLLDNIYIPGQSTQAEKQALLSKVPTETFAGDPSNVWTEMTKTDSTLDDLTDEEIEVIQQLAIWYFTNNTDTNYNSEILPTILQNNVANTDASYKAFADKYNETTGDNPMEYGQWKQDYMTSLYQYLITEAKKHTDYTGNANTLTSPLKLNKNSVVVMTKNSNGTDYIVGPFKIDKINNGDYIDFIAKFEDQDGNKITDYTLLDSNKATTNASIEDLIGNNFYISIPQNSSRNIETVKFTISLSFAKTKLTFLTTGEATYQQDQPVVMIEKTTDDYTDNISSNLFDLALRKFITKVDNNVLTGTESREPKYTNTELENLRDGKDTTVKKTHTKEPREVHTGSLVTYTMRIYNEGNIAGCAKEVTDYLPEGLEFYSSQVDGIDYKWKLFDKNGKETTDPSKAVTLKTDYLKDKVIDAFDKDNLRLDFEDVKVICKVVANVKTTNQNLKNIAAITQSTDSDGNNIPDRDSEPRDLTEDEKNKYPFNPDNSKDKYEDDDDYEDLVLLGKNLDLALRKFITEKNGDSLPISRVPIVETSTIKTTGTATYKHVKSAVSVNIGDIITYTIRVYNEGDINGYVSEITDFLPEYLEYINEENAKTDEEKAAAEFNSNYLWLTVPGSNGRKIKTQITSIDHTDDYSILTGINRKNTLLTAFDGGKTLSYIDVKVKCKVKSNAISEKKITNIAEITGMTDEEKNIVKTDRDSTSDSLIDNIHENGVLPTDDELPEYIGHIDNKDLDPTNPENYFKGQEDDDDFEKLEIKIFDLALRKFITAVNETNYNNRYPEPILDENGKIKYEHTKEPVRVENGNIVIYTIRIFNEGTVAGYAKDVMDDIPDGLEFLPDHEINKEYGWTMYDEAKEEGMYLDYKYANRRYIKTENAKEADIIVTNYLSKDAGEEAGRDNLIQAFNKKLPISTEEPYNPDFRDVKVAFKVTEPNTSDRIIINTAEISEDEDKDGNPIDDIDSTPGNEEEDEDDIDKEYIYVKYFDLSLLKWVTQAIVTIDGKTTVTETGHTGEENPEPVVKVEIKEKNIKKVNVKFKYKIKITNEGEISGYAKEVTDYIPEGLKFIKEDNPNWYERKDGVVATDELADVLLMPGESATVEIILTWINDANNMGLKVNIAEISKDYNDSNTPDIDSTPDNQKPGEDDIDDAPVILTPQTGQARIYYILGTTVLLTMIIGIALIKKYVL